MSKTVLEQQAENLQETLQNNRNLQQKIESRRNAPAEALDNFLELGRQRKISFEGEGLKKKVTVSLIGVTVYGGHPSLDRVIKSNELPMDSAELRWLRLSEKLSARGVIHEKSSTPDQQRREYGCCSYNQRRGEMERWDANCNVGVTTFSLSFRFKDITKLTAVFATR